MEKDTQVGVFMTPEYLERFAETVSERVFEKVKGKFKREDEEPINPEQAAKHLNISERHLLKLARTKAITGHKKPGLPWEFYRSELNNDVRSK